MQCVDLGGRRIIKKIFFQTKDGIRDVERSRGLGDVYKRQHPSVVCWIVIGRGYTHARFHLPSLSFRDGWVVVDIVRINKTIIDSYFASLADLQILGQIVG